MTGRRKGTPARLGTPRRATSLGTRPGATSLGPRPGATSPGTRPGVTSIGPRPGVTSLTNLNDGSLRTLAGHLDPAGLLALSQTSRRMRDAARPAVRERALQRRWFERWADAPTHRVKVAARELVGLVAALVRERPVDEAGIAAAIRGAGLSLRDWTVRARGLRQKPHVFEIDRRITALRGAAGKLWPTYDYNTHAAPHESAYVEAQVILVKETGFRSLNISQAHVSAFSVHAALPREAHSDSNTNSNAEDGEVSADARMDLVVDASPPRYDIGINNQAGYLLDEHEAANHGDVLRAYADVMAKEARLGGYAPGITNRYAPRYA